MRELYEQLQNVDTVNEKDSEILRRELATPTLLPCDFDVTIRGWLARIELWGRIDYVYIDPHTKQKRHATKNYMVNTIENTNLVRMFGKWQFEETDVNQVMLSRTFKDIDNRTYTEKFILTIDLKPVLKKALGPKWKFWRG